VREGVNREDQHVTSQETTPDIRYDDCEAILSLRPHGATEHRFRMHGAGILTAPRKSLMPSQKKPPDEMYFRSLSLENVRAFGRRQSLEFVDEKGSVSLWNLILGENNVGKTTLMQALAVMRPFPTNLRPNDTSLPKLSKAELTNYQNEEIVRFIRRGGVRETTMTAVFQVGGRSLPPYVAKIKGSVDGLKDAVFPTVKYKLRSEGPLVIGYGAGRHVGHRNKVEVSERTDTYSLFTDATDLFDAEEIMAEIDYSAVSGKSRHNRRDARRRDMLMTAIARLLPDLTAAQIEIKGPRVEGLDQSGILIQTPSGKTPLLGLSLGYQTMFAWTVDLAWRLFKAFPDSLKPLSEKAIVLIDEVDLHLHPQWQRSLRRHLRTTFPHVQFIATTHSPTTAQEALTDGLSTVSVVRWDKNEACIIKPPIPRRPWRSDQLLESELFGLDSDRGREAEKKLYERVKLSRKSNRSPKEEALLRQLDKFAASLPAAHSLEAETFEEQMMNLAKDLARVVRR
jgi:hypothetical protein